MRLRLLFSLIVLVTLGTMSAAAQTSDTIQVAVPFAFTVHNVDMPAGIYRFTRASDGNGLLALRNIDTRQETFFLSIPTGFGAATYQSSVAFRAGDGGYSLADVVGRVRFRSPDALGARGRHHGERTAGSYGH